MKHVAKKNMFGDLSIESFFKEAKLLQAISRRKNYLLFFSPISREKIS